MKWIHVARSMAVMAAAGAIGAVCAAPGAPVVTDKAEVSYRNPAGFSEMQRSLDRRTGWLDDLSGYVARRAARLLPDGQRLIVTITDVQRAGIVEPWHGAGATDLRIVRDTTPPRIDLSFQRVAANGAVLKEGSRQLRDIAFLSRTGVHRNEPLSYEKNLIDDWMREEFGSPPR